MNKLCRKVCEWACACWGLGFLALLGSCNDLSQRWELDHARVLAVRLSSPGLAAGEAASVVVLVVDDDGTPAEVVPTQLSLAAAAAAAGGVMSVQGSPAGWTVTAGSREAIEAARAQAGLPDEAALTLQLVVEVEHAGRRLTALKAVRLGQALGNPPTPSLRIDGASGEAEQAISVRSGTSLALTLGGEGEVPAPSFAYAWLTSTGTLSNSETAAATLEVDSADPAQGHLVVLVRDEGGGVAWASREIVVLP